MKGLQLREILRSAFSEAFEDNQAQLDHKACIALRERLLSLEPRDFPYLIGHILLDLLFTQNSKCLDDEGAISVIRFLDGFWPMPVTFDGKGPENELLIAKHKLAAFSALSLEQEKAILAWLMHIRLRPELWLAEEYIDSAIRYWEAPLHRNGVNRL